MREQERDSSRTRIAGGRARDPVERLPGPDARRGVLALHGSTPRRWARYAARWRGAATAAFGISALLHLLARGWATARLGASAGGLVSAVMLAVEATILLGAFRTLRSLVANVGRRGEADRHAGWWMLRSRPPRLAILIPTLNESLPILERSLMGALRQGYPAYEVWVLDDGARPEVRALAEEMGARWYARPTHGGAKAGNLNAGWAMLESRGGGVEFLAVLDADFIAEPTFLSRTLSLMHSDEVALVQTPMCFYNPDNFQAALPGARVPDVLRLNHDITQVCRDGQGQGICCGTSFLVRTASLSAVGGFPTSTVVEDLLLAHRLRKSGARVVYLDEPLSHGLAAERLDAYVVQRRRWYRGFVQLALERGRDESRSPLSRYLAVEAQLRGLVTPVAGTVLLLGPVFSFIPGLGAAVFGVASVASGLAALLIHHVYMTRLSEGRFLPVFAEAVGLIKSFCGVQAVAEQVSGRARLRFQVTPKGLQAAQVRVHRLALTWVVAVAASTGAGLAHLWGLGGGVMGSAVVLAWAAYSLPIVATALAFCLEVRERRGAVRFEGASSAVQVRRNGGEWASARLTDVSERGAQLEAEAPFTIGEALELVIEHVRVPATVARHSAGRLGLAFGEMPRVDRRRLLSLVYSGSRIPHFEGATLAGLGVGLLRRIRSGVPRRGGGGDLPGRHAGEG